MKTIRVGFTDTFDGTAGFFTDWLSREYQVIRDDINPQILFFGDENFGTNNLKYDPSKTIKVFYTGENRRPQNYQCHYAITFDHIESPRHYRLPLYVLNTWYLQKRLDMESPFEHYDRVRSIAPLRNFDTPQKTRFAGFVCSNGGCQERNDFFRELSKYKIVDSGGPLFNNIGGAIPRDENGIQHKLKFLSDKKFTICYENGAHPGYVTEKVLEAYYAETVPLYWGSSTVECDFNTDAMINFDDYGNMEDFMNRIVEVDSDSDLYLAIYKEPLFKDNEPNKYMNVLRFLRWFERITKDLP